MITLPVANFDGILPTLTALDEREKIAFRLKHGKRETCMNRLEIGDRIFMWMEPEARSWGRRGPPDGTIGIVVGFYQYLDHVGRCGITLYDGVASEKGERHTLIPGFYKAEGAPVVQWEKWEHGDGRSFETVSDYDISFVDINLHEMRKYNPKARGYRTFVAPLPETPFYEGDVVLPLPSVDRENYFAKMCRDYGGVVRVTNVNFHYYGKFRDDGSPMPMYDIQYYDDQGRSSGSSSYEAHQLQLISRGNLWKHYHGEKCEFDSILDEVQLQRRLMRYDSVRNPRSGLYHWNFEEAVESMREGIIDAANVDNGLFGSGPRLDCIKFWDEDLGARMREYWSEQLRAEAEKKAEEARQDAIEYQDD